MSQLVTLVNRTTKTLRGTWDGRFYDLEPGKHEFPEIKAMKFKEQNPIMGTENPRTLQKQYLMGIVENGDDISPVEQSDSVALEDLSAKIASGELKLVRANGMYAPATEGSMPLPFDSTNFVKP